MKKSAQQSGPISIEEKRKAAARVLAGEESQQGLARRFGVSRQAVHQWVRLYRAGELVPGRAARGRPKIRNLTSAEGRKIKDILTSKTPAEAGIGEKFTRWDYEATRRLIIRETGVKMTYRIVAEHMERWDVPHGPNLPVVDEKEGVITEDEPGTETPAQPEEPAPPPPPPDPIPKRPRGRPRKIDTDTNGDDEADMEADIDYEAELAKSREFLKKMHHGPRGRHARQRRTPFQQPKKKRKKKR